MKTIIANLQKKQENLYDETRGVLAEIIDEYQQLRNNYGFVPVKVEQKDRTIIGLNYEYDEDIEDYKFHYRCCGKGEHQRFTTDQMFSMIEQIDKLNEPYRKLQKYKEKKDVDAVVLEYVDYQLKKQITLQAKSLNDLFIQFYRMNRTYRYCNGYHYSFDSSNVNSLYQQWLDDMPNEMSMNLYYGNGVVD